MPGKGLRVTNELFRVYLDGPLHHPPELPAERYVVTDELFLEFTILPWQAEVLRRFIVPGYSITTASEALPVASLRSKALAAKASRGHGPGSSASWRGRERSTRYRNQ